MEIRELTCIVCPMGCRLTAEIGEDGIKISGNTCKRGAEYGLRELTDPTRVVTSTVRLENGTCPVKTAAPVRKAAIGDVLGEIRTVRAQRPIRIGDVLRRNIAGTGVDLVATANRE